MEPVPNTTRLDRTGVWLWNERSIHFSTVVRDGEPLLMKQIGQQRGYLLELNVELIDDRYDLWMRLFRPADEPTIEHMFDLTDEILLGKALIDTRALAGVIKEFMGAYPDLTDKMCLFVSDDHEDDKVYIVKPIPEREFGLQFMGYDSLDSALPIIVRTPDDSDMIAVHLAGSLKFLAGIEVKYNEIDLGYWDEDEEWVSVATIDLNGNRVPR